MASFYDLTVGQETEFRQVLAAAGFTREEILAVNSDSSLASDMRAAVRAKLALPEQFYPVRDYSKYTPYLRSLSDQLELLRELNRRMPRGLRVRDARLDLDPTSTHVQGVEDLEHWFVQFDTLEQTWAFNQKLVEFTQPAIWDSGFARDARSMRLHRTAHQYAPGVHRVRLNLVDNWEPEKGRDLHQVWSRALASGKELAAVEPIGAYALQSPQLYQSQDGENLPYFDCAGLGQGAGFAQVPYSCGGGLRRDVCFGAGPAGTVSRVYAAPSVLPQGVL